MVFTRLALGEMLCVSPRCVWREAPPPLFASSVWRKREIVAERRWTKDERPSVRGEGGQETGSVFGSPNGGHGKGRRLFARIAVVAGK